MAFNGLGAFSRLYSWANDAAAGIKIRADRSDDELNGIATGLSNCICKDGQTTISANLPMATFRHTGVGDGVARTDYASLGQVQDGTVQWIASGGTVSAITAAYSPAITTLVDGMVLGFRATGANTSTTPTFSPNGLTARTIVRWGGVALAAGDIPRANYECLVRYNLANTRWELLNPVASPGTITGSTASTATGVNVTIFTPSGSVSALYLVWANLSGAAGYASYAICFYDANGGAVSRIAGTNAANGTISATATAIQTAQSSGSNQIMEYGVTRLGA